MRASKLIVMVGIVVLCGEVGAACETPNPSVLAAVKAAAASGSIDNYTLEKQGHGDKMAVIIEKSALVALNDPGIKGYMSSLFGIQASGCSVISEMQEAGAQKDGATQRGEVKLKNTLMCECEKTGEDAAKSGDGVEDKSAKQGSQEQKTPVKEFF